MAMGVGPEYQFNNCLWFDDIFVNSRWHAIGIADELDCVAISAFVFILGDVQRRAE